jgi:hypothetical protein
MEIAFAFAAKTLKMLTKRCVSALMAGVAVRSDETQGRFV